MSKRFLLLATLLALFPSLILAQNFALSARVGTLGVGGEITTSLTPRLNLRLGGHYFPTYTFSGTAIDGDVAYDLKAKLLSIGGVLDLYPFKKGFRLSGGVYYNLNKAEGTGRPTRSYSVGSTTYGPDRLGSLTASLEAGQQLSPYAGIGWGNAVGKSRVSFLIDIGALYIDRPVLEFTGEGLIAPTAEQGPQIQEDLDQIRFYPVVALGLAIRL